MWCVGCFILRLCSVRSFFASCENGLCCMGFVVCALFSSYYFFIHTHCAVVVYLFIMMIFLPSISYCGCYVRFWGACIIAQLDCKNCGFRKFSYFSFYHLFSIFNVVISMRWWVLNSLFKIPICFSWWVVALLTGLLLCRFLFMGFTFFVIPGMALFTRWQQDFSY